MAFWILLLMTCGSCGYSIGRWIKPPRRLPIICLWVATPSSLWLLTGVLIGGPTAPLAVPMALMVLVAWGVPSLLAFVIGHLRSEEP